MKGIIFDLKRFSVHDGPGVRTTVFLKGCPLSCLWCHSPESMDAKITKIPKLNKIGELDSANVEQVGREVSETLLMLELIRDRIFWEESGGGVSFSGGEPLMQHEFLKSMLLICQNEHIHTVVDTSGYVSDKIWSTIFPLANLILYDLKLMDDHLHKTYTGVSNKLILNNLKILSKSDTSYRLRIPMIPGVTMTDENLQQVLAFLQTLEKAPQGIDLLPFQRTSKHQHDWMVKINPFFKEHVLLENEIEHALQLFNDAGFSVKIEG